jgi:hypothetical protein
MVRPEERPHRFDADIGASDSIRLSKPKPISAMDEATMPAATAMANSTKCHALPPQASSRARLTRRARSSAGGSVSTVVAKVFRLADVQLTFLA